VPIADLERAQAVFSTVLSEHAAAG
jgi:hypothetical protein